MQTRARGITIIESAVWIGVFTFAMLALVTTLIQFYSSNRYTVDQASAVASVQRGIDSSVRVMREAAYASDGAFPIVDIGTNSFTFYADVDDDPFLERVRFFVEGSEFKRGIIDWGGETIRYSGAETVSTISTYVRNTDQSVQPFRFYDKNGVEITNYTSEGDTRFVTLTLVVAVTPGRLPHPLTLRSSAALRNLIGK